MMALTTFCKIRKKKKTGLHSAQTKLLTTYSVRYPSHYLLPATFFCKRNVLVGVSKVVTVDVSHHPFSTKFHTNDHYKMHLMCVKLSLEYKKKYLVVSWSIFRDMIVEGECSGRTHVFTEI